MMVVEISYSDHPAASHSATSPDRTPTRPLNDSYPWIPLAPSTAFPDLPLNQRIAAPPPDPWDEPSTTAEAPRCRIFKIDTSQNPEGSEVETLTEITLSEAQLYCSWQPQLLVFRSKGKFWAVQHACPHRGAALSRGRLVDLEDAVGVVCAVHGWAFELETGMGSKGINVGVWETREVEGRVWVRRRG